MSYGCTSWADPPYGSCVEHQAYESNTRVYFFALTSTDHDDIGSVSVHGLLRLTKLYVIARQQLWKEDMNVRAGTRLLHFSAVGNLSLLTDQEETLLSRTLEVPPFG